ncbi:hypothetical protein FRB99_002677 [Tulasnella sp. 403]|nr:hypothetical protein FRB99_002677 [Tulasnella sp. 403]
METKSTPASKKRKTNNSKKGVRSVGKLRHVLELPVEVVLEIARHLHPANLVQLSRVSKRFRSLLMSRASRPVWQSSLSTVKDLPPCPANFSEPAYARLCFLNECYGCLAPTSATRDFVIRGRYCKPCKLNRSLMVDAAEIGYNADGFSAPDLLAVLPHTYSGSADQRKYFLKKDLVKFLVDAATVEDECFEEWLETQRSEIMARVQQQIAYNIWYNQGYRSMKRAFQDIAESRLRSAGWTPEDFKLVEWTKTFRQLTRQKREMTERIWTNLLPKLNEILRLRKEEDASGISKINSQFPPDHWFMQYIPSLQSLALTIIADADD